MTDHPFKRNCFDAEVVFKALKDPAFRARLLADPSDPAPGEGDA